MREHLGAWPRRAGAQPALPRRGVMIRLSRRLAAAALLLACLAAPALAPAQTLKEDREAALATLNAFRAEAAPLLEALADQAAYCFARADTGHAVFRGCVDWHSAAHAAWALTAHARATGATRHLALLRRRMTAEGLAEEARLLRRRPRFETPYGRAWLLRLALERRALAQSEAAAPPDLSAFADETAQGLLLYFSALRARRGLDPRVHSYDNPSWALFNLIAYLRVRSVDADGAWAQQALQDVAVWVRHDFVRPAPDCAARLQRKGFMAVCANWAALAASVLPPDEARAWTARFFAANPIPEPVQDPDHPHHFGLNFSRAWAYWTIWVNTGESRFADAYVAHIVASAPRGNWAGRYIVNGHWVAQFGVFALQPLFSPRAEAALTR